MRHKVQTKPKDRSVSIQQSRASGLERRDHWLEWGPTHSVLLRFADLGFAGTDGASAIMT